MSGKVLAPHKTAIVAAALVVIASYLIPPVHLVLLPLQFLNTHFHELCHALMAVATGGNALYIKVFGDGSGVTPFMGGNVFLTASAGYIGATLVGSAAIFFGRTPERARVVLAVLASALTVSLLLWVRGDMVGVVAGWLWAIALFAAARFLRGQTAVFAVQLIGLEQCLNSIGSIYELLKISAFTDRDSDAKILASFTYIPAPAWASLWCVFSLLMVGLTVRSAWSRRIQGPGGQQQPAGPLGSV